MKPRVAFQVPNKLTGEGNLPVEITFESMDDFSPAAIARKVEPLRKLLEARTQLSNLITYMDGKSGAEELIAKTLQDPALLKSLAATPKPRGRRSKEASHERRRSRSTGRRRSRHRREPASSPRCSTRSSSPRPTPRAKRSRTRSRPWPSRRSRTPR